MRPREEYNLRQKKEGDSLKIALICTEKLPVPPIDGGAVQLYIEGIAPYLSKHHDVTIFSISHPKLLPEEVKENVRYIRVGAKTDKEYINNLKLKLTYEFDLVLVYNRPSWILPLSENLPNTKFGLSIHNEMFLPEKISTLKAEQTIDRVSFINTVSKFIADGIEMLYPKASDKLNVIYSGVDVEQYKANWSQEGIRNKKILKQKYDIEGFKVVLFIGRLSVKKGVHILLKAMRDVMNIHRNTALVIVGSKWYGENKEDDYTKYVHQLSESLNGPIIFTGFLPPTQIPQHYNLGDVFVCPSQWNEPLARVHYEAMAAGLPIITTNRGGNAEVCRDGNAIIIDNYDNQSEFEKNISYLLENDEKALELGKNGREVAEEKYNWERVANDVLRAIESAGKSTIIIPKPQLPPVGTVPSSAEILNKDAENNDFFSTEF